MAVYKFITGENGDWTVQKDSGAITSVPGNAEASATVYEGKVRVQSYYPYYEALINLTTDHVEIDGINKTADGAASIVTQLNDDVFVGEGAAGGSASLQETQIGFGNASNELSGSSDFVYDVTDGVFRARFSEGNGMFLTLNDSSQSFSVGKPSIDVLILDISGDVYSLGDLSSFSNGNSIVIDNANQEAFLKIAQYSSATNGQVLSLVDNLTGKVGWVNPVADNIYSVNGTLDSNRTITLDDNYIKFDNTGFSLILNPDTDQGFILERTLSVNESDTYGLRNIYTVPVGISTAGPSINYTVLNADGVAGTGGGAVLYQGVAYFNSTADIGVYTGFGLSASSIAGSVIDYYEGIALNGWDNNSVIDYAYQIYISSIVNVVGSINHNYGVFIQDVAGGSIDNYAIYTGAGAIRFGDTPEFADNAAAVAGSLAVGTLYRTGDILKIVHA